ncbi:MFS transporter [Candidatus Clavichlamydia salmonicola]|uniref:MFS transporter n=1 Tax=Candidatus Clavichlamydia salmonicola TaxID=469812 RepID=UPI0018913B2C|nr:MFS transporter [Candidatus Clavichlamydia salmonicola]
MTKKPTNIFKRFFNPPPHRPEIKNPEKVDRRYRYWRMRIFYSIFSGYVFYYFTRKSFTFAMPMLIADLGFDKADLGILGSILYISYGLSKFASGILSDQSNPRYFMAFGLIITGIANICFGLSSTLVMFSIFWGINGWFQGWGWPPCARLLTHWYSQNERGSWWSIWSTSHNIGGFLIPIVMAYAVQFFGWRGAMFLPSILCIGVGFFLINRLRDTPQSLGLPSIEKYRNDYPESSEAGFIEEKELTSKQLLFDHVLKNKWVWLLAVASFFVYVVRMAINDWSALFLIETKKYSVLQANLCVSMFEIGGLFGMISAGWLSDKLSSGKRGPMNSIFSLGMAVVIVIFWLNNHSQILLDGSCLFLIGFFLFGPQMMIGLAAAELSHKKAAGTASGFTGWFAYFGAAVAGYPLGKLAEDHGWPSYFAALTICAIVAFLLFLPTWKVKGNNKA